MAEFRIGVDLGHLVPVWAPIRAESFPNLAGAVKMISEAAHRQWSAYAAGARMPTGQIIQDRTGTYLRSIQLRQTGPFSAEVFSDLPYARAIEEGTPARDMKKILQTSLKVRLSAKGRRYLIIPFRHNTPGSVMGNNLPPAVHTWWKGQAASSIVQRVSRVSGTGAWSIKTRSPITVAARRYSWGARLSKSHLAGLGADDAAKRRLAGMVMFRKPRGSGYGAHSQFIIFRVMSENSTGWIAPARAGKFPAKTTADLIRPIATEAFRAAVTKDIEALLGG